MTQVTHPGPRPVYVPVHPRIRRRQIEVRRAEGRRRLRVLVVGASLSAVAVAGAGAVRSPLLDVDRVVVQGGTHLEPVDIARAAGVPLGQPMIEVDTANAARSVAALAWVADVEVRRDWPGTVRIRVTERVPIAVSSVDSGGWALIDRLGTVLDHAVEPPPGLVVLEGVGGLAPPGSTVSGADGLLTTAAAIPPALRPVVVAVAPAADGVELRLRPRGRVRLGPADNLGAKFAALETVLAQVDTSGILTLDVRFPSSPSLTREPSGRRVSTLSTG